MYYYYKKGEVSGSVYLPSGSRVELDIGHLEGPFDSVWQLLESLPESYDGGGTAVKVLYIPEVH